MSKYYNRRLFLQGIIATAGAVAFNGCSQKQTNQTISQAEVEPIIKPETLEKPNLNIGFVPVNDCAPFAIAYEKGFFRKYGLNVTLSREASWANSRDGLIFGRLDASPVVSGTVMNARLSAEGSRHFPLCAAMTIHRHGNALTMNRKLWEGGIRPWDTYNNNLDAFGQDLRNYWQKSPLDERIWAVPLSSAVYEYFVRYLLASVGLNPIQELRLIITPPPQMVSNMRMDAMQAYMVGEPWNTRAITGNENIGFTFIQGREILRGHPDRILAVQESFIEENPKTYRSLVKAMIEACRYCGKQENRPEVAQIISQRSFTGANIKYTEPGIVGNYNYGGFDDQPRIKNSLETTMFFDLPSGVSNIEHDHSTFLWQSDAMWLMTQAYRWGQLNEFPNNAEEIVKKSWRTDLYREIAQEIGINCPKENYQVIDGKAFIDGKPFDSSNPMGYINSFDIRANSPQIYSFA